MRAGVESWAPWLAGLVLFVGSVAYAASRLGVVDVAQTGPAAAEPRVRLDPKASVVARAFVQTTVSRWRRPLARNELVRRLHRRAGAPGLRT